MARFRALALAALLLCAGCASLPRSAPPAAVRVAFDPAGITDVHTEGLADRRTGRRPGPGDPVRIASISKLATAIGVMRLVEAGKLDLDADISGLLGYSVRNPAFPDVPITLRLLLSHRSSLRDGAGYALPLGRHLADTLADPAAWDREHAPGRWFHYTNLNFPVIASVMERATGERFDRLMQRLLFAPLNMDACFNWTSCSDRAVRHAVVLYDASGAAVRDDLGGRRPDCPVLTTDGQPCDLSGWRPGDNGSLFSPQGGLRISMRDLARLGMLLANQGTLGGVRLLSPESVALLETPVWQFDGADGDTDKGFFCRYGLAMQTLATPAAGCADDPFGDRITRVGHAGEAYGLRSGLWFDTATGRGVAFFVTAVPDGARGMRSAFSPGEERMSEAAAADQRASLDQQQRGRQDDADGQQHRRSPARGRVLHRDHDAQAR